MTNGVPTIEVDTIKNSITTAPVVYLCAEFALDVKLPIYAGGLGILAGDVLAQAGEEGRSYLGIGMMYHHGYLRQAISKEANLFEGEDIDPEKSGLQLLTRSGTPVTTTITIHARTVTVKAWVYMLGKVPLLLLDTDVEGNEAQDIGLCDRLYYGDREHRFKQEMILGIAGMRLFAELAITPRLYHLNEGHSALMMFELARQRCLKGPEKNVQKILETLGDIIFTNHTLVPAGNDVFSKDLVISYLASFALEFPVDPATLVKFGLIQDTSLFSPTMLALRLATVSQAVSKLHATKALEAWPDHPLVPVTNGVRQKYWQADEIAGAFTSSQNSDISNQQEQKNSIATESLNLKSNSSALWNAHLIQKRKLITYIEANTGFTWEENALIITWSRRLASYKRPLLLMENKEHLRTLLNDANRPVRLLLSGKPHAHDEQAQKNLQEILTLVGESGGKVVYLQNYNIDLARIMMAGSDVLLNTPIRGMEACGTSGMKASMNGVIQCTTLDGWTDEVDWNGMGWTIGDENSAENLYQIVENEIIPLFFKRDERGIPIEWVDRMQKTITMAVERYSAKRMLAELEALVYSQIKKVD